MKPEDESIFDRIVEHAEDYFTMFRSPKGQCRPLRALRETERRKQETGNLHQRQMQCWISMDIDPKDMTNGRTRCD